MGGPPFVSRKLCHLGMKQDTRIFQGRYIIRRVLHVCTNVAPHGANQLAQVDHPCMLPDRGVRPFSSGLTTLDADWRIMLDA